MKKTKRPDEFPLISLLFVYFEHFLSRKPDNGIKTWKLTGLYSITIQRESKSYPSFDKYKIKDTLVSMSGCKRKYSYSMDKHFERFM